jgi:NTP pyrophosphatase (non-canonical NTP hydrolase)
MMSFEEYQNKAWSTAIYPNIGENIYYPTLGLVGEAGEIANKIKKIMRDNGGILTIEKRNELIAEMGDVLWYLAALATELKTSLNTIAYQNLDKLFSRLENGTIKGEGDSR